MLSLAFFSIYIHTHTKRTGLKKVGNFEGDKTTPGKPKGQVWEKGKDYIPKEAWRWGVVGQGKDLQEGIRPIESRQMALIPAEQLALPCHGEYWEKGGEALTWSRTSVRLPCDMCWRWGLERWIQSCRRQAWNLGHQMPCHILTHARILGS